MPEFEDLCSCGCQSDKVRMSYLVSVGRICTSSAPKITRVAHSQLSEFCSFPFHDSAPRLRWVHTQKTGLFFCLGPESIVPARWRQTDSLEHHEHLSISTMCMEDFAMCLIEQQIWLLIHSVKAGTYWLTKVSLVLLKTSVKYEVWLSSNDFNTIHHLANSVWVCWMKYDSLPERIQISPLWE